MMAEAFRQWITNGWRFASFWGLWPTVIMILSQWEAASLLSAPYERPVLLITIAGTLTVYGADRWLEVRFLTATSARHHATLGLATPGMMTIIAATGFAGLLLMEFVHVPWLLGLGVCGSIYLLVTVRILPLFPGGKETLGALCFCILIWGAFPHWQPPFLLSFFLLGLSNFLWAGWDDRERDALNGLRSPAVIAPRTTAILARALAAFACTSFLVFADWQSPFVWVSGLHAMRWWNEKHSIDWAFLPLLAITLPF